MKDKASLLLFRFPPKPARLSLWVRAGIGADKLERTIRITHHGRTIAQLKVEGGGRLLSEPLTPEGELDRVDIQVAERSRPMPRRFTLWNEWVLQDPRSLSLGAYDVRIVDAENLAGLPVVAPGVYQPDAVRSTFLYNGLHSDDWLGARFRLGVPAKVCDKVVFRAELVRLGDGDLPFRIGVTVDGVPQPEVALESYGDVALAVELPRSEGLHWIELSPERHLTVQTFHMEGQDLREISIRLKSVALVPHGR
jgi:hypothetical protein